MTWIAASGLAMLVVGRSWPEATPGGLQDSPSSGTIGQRAAGLEMAVPRDAADRTERQLAAWDSIRDVDLEIRCSVTGTGLTALAMSGPRSVSIWNGAGRMQLPRADVVVRIVADGFLPLEIAVGRDQISIHAVLQPRQTAAVVVRDAAGRPIGGSSVWAHRSEGVMDLGRTDLAGRWSGSVPFPVLLSASSMGRASPVTIVASAATVDLVLDDPLAGQFALVPQSSEIGMSGTLKLNIAMLVGDGQLPFVVEVDPKGSVPRLMAGRYRLDSRQPPYLVSLVGQATGTDPLPIADVRPGSTVSIVCHSLSTKRIRAVALDTRAPLAGGWYWAEGYEQHPDSRRFGWSLMGAIRRFDGGDGVLAVGALFGGVRVEGLPAGHLRIGVAGPDHGPAWVAFSDLDPDMVRDVVCAPATTLSVAIEVEGDQAVQLAISRVLESGGPLSVELPIHRATVRGHTEIMLVAAGGYLKFRVGDWQGPVVATLRPSNGVAERSVVRIAGLSRLVVTGVPADAGPLFASTNGITLHASERENAGCVFAGLPAGNYEIGDEAAIRAFRRRAILLAKGRFVVPQTTTLEWTEVNGR